MHRVARVTATAIWPSCSSAARCSAGDMGCGARLRSIRCEKYMIFLPIIFRNLRAMIFSVARPLAYVKAVSGCYLFERMAHSGRSEEAESAQEAHPADRAAGAGRGCSD